ncbi:hypothetical protein [Clostridium peptidivorans]|uniref:hypothetical protein n=1 Tax=Clostridium peptidivorans TaxID=100174 RepID=UPI0015C6E47E|nr:hypothetical protein [Clostridium peptidivorans]
MSEKIITEIRDKARKTNADIAFVAVMAGIIFQPLWEYSWILAITGTLFIKDNNL